MTDCQQTRRSKVFDELANSDRAATTSGTVSTSWSFLPWIASGRPTYATRQSLINQYPKSKHRFYVACSQAESYLASRPGEPELAAAEKLKVLEGEAANDESTAPWFDRVWVLLAELNFREKKYSDVVKVVDEFKHRSPKSPSASGGRSPGTQLQTAGTAKFDDARAAFERVLADPFAAKTRRPPGAIHDRRNLVYREKWDTASLAFQRSQHLQVSRMAGRRSARIREMHEAQNEWKPPSKPTSC